MPEPFDWNHAPDTADTRPVAECPRCGTLTIREEGHAAPCAVCADTTRANPHGTAPGPAERLFEPAPAPMPGQIMGRWDPYQ
jgi:hypothetical protein